MIKDLYEKIAAVDLKQFYRLMFQSFKQIHSTKK